MSPKKPVAPSIKVAAATQKVSAADLQKLLDGSAKIVDEDSHVLHIEDDDDDADAIKPAAPRPTKS